MAIIPRRTGIILVLLIIFIAIIAYFRFFAPRPVSTPNPPLLSEETSPLSEPFPSITPLPTPSNPASPSAIPLPTPLPVNPQTGWLQYQNPFHQFSFEFPQTWQLQDFGQSYSPMASVISQLNEQPIGFTVSAPSWGSESELSQAKLVSPFNYQGWVGGRYQVTDAGVTLTIVTATKSAALGRNYRINWVYPDSQGAIDTYLKPILNTFKFNTNSASSSAQPNISE